jgi:hypothetical protein
MGGSVFRDPSGLCAVAASDVDHTFTRLEGEGRDGGFEESPRRFLNRELWVVLPLFLPEPVVEMFAPELAVEKVELVVVTGDVGCGGD